MRIRNELGWTYSTAKYCQAIRDANKQKRLDWCTNLIAKKEKFDDVIFTDESTFRSECHRRMCFRKKKMPRKLKYKHKHPPKIPHVGHGSFVYITMNPAVLSHSCAFPWLRM